MRGIGLDVECLDARRVKAALRTRENDAKGLGQIAHNPMRRRWLTKTPPDVPMPCRRRHRLNAKANTVFTILNDLA
jgi:hypothetical protein